MTDLIGDVCQPSDLSLPIKTTTEANAMSGANLIDGTVIFNDTLNKAEVWTGSVWETITSVGR